MKKKEDLEKDLKSLEVHRPSEGFTLRVTMKAMQQLHTHPDLSSWVKRLPSFCIGGFVLTFLVLAYLVIHYFNVEPIDANTLFAFKVFGMVGGGILLFIWLDQWMKKVMVGE
jgi:hypothetical protein